MRRSPPPPRHPGRILEEDFLSRLPEGTTQGEVAERLAMSRPRLNDLIHGRRSVTLDTALRLARCFGTTPEFWLRAQMEWDLHQARRSRAQMREIERVEPWSLREPDAPGGGVHPEPAQGPAPVVPRAAAWEQGGDAVYYEEFLRRRGMLEEARRFARVQAQLDVLEPHRPDARRRLQRPLRVSDYAITLPPIPLRRPAEPHPQGPRGAW